MGGLGPNASFSGRIWTAAVGSTNRTSFRTPIVAFREKGIACSLALFAEGLLGLMRDRPAARTENSEKSASQRQFRKRVSGLESRLPSAEEAVALLTPGFLGAY